jgi:NarL family two-component system sensor histidine kinase LiaS
VEHDDPACQTANAIDLERLHARAQQAATLEQRQALACDVHDSVMQTLFSLHLAAEVALDCWEREPAQAHAALEMAVRLIRDAKMEMRTLLFELRENALGSEGLAGALEKYVDLIRCHHDLRIQLQVACDVRLPAPYQEILYRLVQEGLMNVVKHAQARHASIILNADGAGISLRIEDDGIGFAQAEPECASCGLMTMRERVSKLGGTLRLGSRPQDGAYVYAALPMPEEHS